MEPLLIGWSMPDREHYWPTLWGPPPEPSWPPLYLVEQEDEDHEEGI
jgi:hypothetical protein